MTEINPVNPVLQNNGLAKARAVKAEKRAARLAIEAAAKAAGVEAPPEAKAETPRRNRPAHTFAPDEAQTRAPVRVGGRVEVLGRDNEVLTRRRTSTGDIFDFPLHLIPKDWEYQWCAISVVGNSDMLLDQNMMFNDNGWRPVPANRYPGKFMPVGHRGSIIRGAQMLMERPKPLCDEARADDIKAAKQLISDRNESLKLGAVKKQMTDGFEMSGKYRGTGGNIRMSIDRALDVPTPQHTPLAED